MCATSSIVTDSRRAAPPDSSAIVARSRAAATKALLECCICNCLYPGREMTGMPQILGAPMIHGFYDGLMAAAVSCCSRPRYCPNHGFNPVVRYAMLQQQSFENAAPLLGG